MKKILDSISTVTWLGMDICWMYDWLPGALLFMILTIVGLVFHAEASEPLSVYDLFVHLATFCWVLSNSMWMLGDFYEHRLFDILKTIFVCFGVLFILLVAYHDISKLRSIRKFDK